MRRVALVVVTAAIALAGAGPAAAYWHSAAWNFRWPSRLFTYHHTFYVPASNEPLVVDVDAYRLSNDVWTTIPCGSVLSSDRVVAVVAYTVAYTRIDLYARTGIFCHFPTAGTWSTVTFFYSS